MSLSMIAAMDRNRVIGKEGDLPWHYSADMKWFREHTLGTSIIMGRGCFDSLNRKPLPDRENIVISHDPVSLPDSVRAAGSPAEALEIAQHEPVIIGGQQIYDHFLNRVETLYLTLVPGTHDGDTYFPNPSRRFWVVREFRKQKVNEGSDILRFLILEATEEKLIAEDSPEDAQLPPFLSQAVRWPDD